MRIKHNQKILEITAKDYKNDPKINGLFEIDPISLKSITGNTLGQVKFYIYKTVKSYSDVDKEPFLVVKGRPLGDTSLSEMPSLSQHKEIWQSNTITGYVVCDAIEPNQMRIGLANTDARTPFFNAMASASITLKGLNTAWKKELSAAVDQEMTNEVIQTVTMFLSKKGIKFYFKNPLQKGIQDVLHKPGEDLGVERTSTELGEVNHSRIVSDGDETVEVEYQPTKTSSRKPREPNDVIIVPNASNKKDGSKLTQVKIKRSLVSKGGRRIRKAFSGPDLNYNADEDCGNELSYFEPEPPTVFIQTEHNAWKKLSKKARMQSNSEKFEKEKKQYVIERYLWEIMHNKSIQLDSEITNENRSNMFWTYFHEITDTR